MARVFRFVIGVGSLVIRVLVIRVWMSSSAMIRVLRMIGVGRWRWGLGMVGLLGMIGVTVRELPVVEDDEILSGSGLTRLSGQGHFRCGREVGKSNGNGGHCE